MLKNRLKRVFNRAGEYNGKLSKQGGGQGDRQGGGMMRWNLWAENAPPLIPNGRRVAYRNSFLFNLTSSFFSLHIDHDRHFS